jgi:hypothetical protein
MRMVVVIPIIVVAVIVVAGALWFGVGYGLTRATGPVVSQDREIPAVTRVDVSGEGTLIIRRGEIPALRVEAQQKVLDRLETKVTDDTLQIQPRLRWLDHAVFWGNAPVTYYLTVPDLTAVKVSGAVAIRGGSPFGAEEFVIECSGSSGVDLEVQARSVQVRTSGSSDITLSGRADIVTFDNSGSTRIFARTLESRIATINCSGSSRIEVNASERLDINASGSSTVAHVGDPVLTTNISGSGAVRRLAQ